MEQDLAMMQMMDDEIDIVMHELDAMEMMETDIGNDATNDANDVWIDLYVYAFVNDVGGVINYMCY